MPQYYDSFTAADGTLLSSHTPDSGGGGPWTLLTGASPTINSNQLDGVSSNDAGLTFPLASGDVPSAVKITLITVTSGQSMGISLRQSAGNTCVYARAAGALGKYQLNTLNAGTNSNLANGTAVPANGDVIELSMSGDTFTLKVNGVVDITHTSTFNNTATGCGLSSYFPDAAYVYDDFYVTYTNSGGGTTVALTGESSTSSTGSLGVSMSISMTGQQSASAQGIPVPGFSIPLTGESSTSAPGTLSPELLIALAGQQANSASGTLTPAISVALTGQQVNSAVGNLGTPGNVTVQLVGQGITSAVGTPIPAISVQTLGQAVSASQGSLTPAISLTLAGEALAAQIGSLGPEISVGLTGQLLTSAAGALIIAGLPTVSQAWLTPGRGIVWVTAPRGTTWVCKPD